MSIKGKVINGVKWTTLNQVGTQFLRVSLTIVLARILSPEDFGTVAMVTILTGFSDQFVNFGFSSAIIQKNEISQKELSSIFWFNALIGVGLTSLILSLANYISEFYDKPYLISVTCFISFMYLFNSLSIVQNALFLKEMKFKLLAIRSFLSVAISGGVGIGLAYYNYGYWSIAIMLVLKSFLFTVIIWFSSNWRPSFYFSYSSLKESLSFSLFIFINNVVSYFTHNIDNLLVGKVFGDKSLGLYTKSYAFVNLPVNTISSIFSKVSLPVFSRYKENDALLVNMYFKTFFLMSLPTFLLMLPIFIDTESFILVFFW